MWKKYVPYVSSIVFFTAALLGITLLGALIYGIITGIWSGAGLFRAPLFLRTTADVLFFEGGIMLTLGALVEFFLSAYSRPLARWITLPLSLAGGMAMPGAPGKSDDPWSGGWMLIFSGAILLISSLAFAVIYMK